MEASFPRRGKMGERMLYMKKFLSLLLVLGLLGSSQVALAAEESPAPLPGWSHSILADGYSLGLFGDEISVQHSQTVTMEQVEALARTVGDKLALLELEPRPADGTALVLDTTRGGVMNALYQEAAAYSFPGVEQGAEAFMTSVGALAGDGSGLHLDRPCTVLEFAAMQTYPAGDSLANHISPALYQAVVQAAAQLGMDEGTVSQYKPWALANSFSSLATLDETSSENAMAIDLYVNAKAINAGIGIGAVETYAFQGQIFDTLSPEYQEQYLAGGLLLILDPDSISQETRDALTQVLGEDAFQPATQEAIQAQLDQISAMMDSWKARDAAEFDAVYGKDAILDSEDELNQKLFTGRDPGMIQYAADYLSQPGSHTGLLVVGAGHMVGDTGVVQGLRDLGYTVELVPVP